MSQEHMATALANTILTKVRDQTPLKERNRRKALLSCVSGNSHSLGLKMINDYLEIQGYKTNSLGGGCPTDAILSQIHRQKPDLICLSVELSGHLLGLKKTIEAIHSEFYSNRPYILVGGWVINAIAITAKEVQADVTADGMHRLEEVLL